MQKYFLLTFVLIINCAAANAGNCQQWSSLGLQTLCKNFGVKKTQAFEAQFAQEPNVLGEYEKTVVDMFSGKKSQADFFRQRFAELPPEQWRFVVSLERGREQLKSRIISGNKFTNSAGNWVYNTVENISGGMLCKGSLCYEREETLRSRIAKEPRRKEWKHVALSANTGKRTEHNVGCYTYETSKGKIELAVDAWGNSFTSAEDWWRTHDPTALGEIENICGKNYCGPCVCLYESYKTVKMGLAIMPDLDAIFETRCPDYAAEFEKTNSRYKSAMAAHFGSFTNDKIPSANKGTK